MRPAPQQHEHVAAACVSQGRRPDACQTAQAWWLPAVPLPLLPGGTETVLDGYNHSWLSPPNTSMTEPCSLSKGPTCTAAWL